MRPSRSPRPGRPGGSSRLGLSVAMVLGLIGLAGCSGAGPSGADGYEDLPTSGVPDYQLGGAYTPDDDVTIVERDSTSKPAPDTYSICYVNGFQAQPGDRREWLSKHPDSVLRDDDGDPVFDPGWPDEMLLDTTTAAARSGILEMLKPMVQRCADRGFDAVEYDNLDSWTRSDHRLTRAGNLALAASLVDLGHDAGLAVGQKNTPQLGSRGRDDAGFDFAVAEECHRYRECAAYTRAYGDRVIDIEYTDDLRGSWRSVCASSTRPAMTILRDRDLVPRGDAQYVFKHC